MTTPTDKESVVALDEQHAKLLLRDIEDSRFPFNELMMHERNTLSAAIRRALSPTQGDGMRDALVKAREILIQVTKNRRALGPIATHAQQCAAQITDALSSHPDRQPGMTDEQAVALAYIVTEITDDSAPCKFPGASSEDIERIARRMLSDPENHWQRALQKNAFRCAALKRASQRQ